MVYSWEMLFVLIAVIAIISNQIVYVNAETLLPPLKQFKSGIPVQDIKCKTGFVLVIKLSNGYPYCVKPTSEQRLLAHGWILPKLESMPINHNETVNTLTQKNMMPVSNGTGNGTITASMIHKWYKDWQAGTQDPDHEVSGAIPLSPLQVTPTISSTNPNSIKILFIGMSPNPLKVGDQPQFTLTYQNISDKPIYTYSGCTATLLGVVMSPSDNVIVNISSGERGLKCPNGVVLINPNQINTDVAGPDPTNGNIGTSMYSSFSPGFYQIIKSGTLHVTMELFLQNKQEDRNDLMETIQFDVNVAGTNDTSNTLSNIIPQKNMTNKVYALSNSSREIEYDLTKPVQIISGTYAESSTKPNTVKILSVGILPYPIKVGDMPIFTITYQNISDKVMHHTSGCGASSLDYTLSPPDYVQEIPPGGTACPEYTQYVQPNGTAGDYGRSDHLNGFYKIVKPGTLNIVMKEYLSTYDRWDIIVTVQFSVNATQ